MMFRLMSSTVAGLEGMDRALNLNDSGNIGLPFRPDDGGRRIKHGNGSGFMAIALLLIDRLNTRKRHGRIASGRDLLT